MKNHESVKRETNPSVYRKARKKDIAKKTGLCSLCPWHSGENAGLSRKVRKNWKAKVKSPKQYRSKYV